MLCESFCARAEAPKGRWVAPKGGDSQHRVGPGTTGTTGTTVQWLWISKSSYRNAMSLSMSLSLWSLETWCCYIIQHRVMHRCLNWHLGQEKQWNLCKIPLKLSTVYVMTHRLHRLQHIASGHAVSPGRAPTSALHLHQAAHNPASLVRPQAHTAPRRDGSSLCSYLAHALSWFERSNPNCAVTLIISLLFHLNIYSCLSSCKKYYSPVSWAAANWHRAYGCISLHRWGGLPYLCKAITLLCVFLLCRFELQTSIKPLFVTTFSPLCIIKLRKILCLIPGGNITLPVKAWSNTAALYAPSLLIGTVIYPAFFNINSLPINRVKLRYLKWNSVWHKVVHPLSPSLASITRPAE